MGKRRYSDSKTFKNLEDYPKEDPTLIPKHTIIKLNSNENIYGIYLK